MHKYFFSASNIIQIEQTLYRDLSFSPSSSLPLSLSLLHATKISGKRGHELKGELGGTQEDIEGGKGRKNDVIIISKINNVLVKAGFLYNVN